MATGKTQSQYIVITMQDNGGVARDITCSVDTIGGIGITNDEIDVSTFCDTVHQYLAGLGDANLTLGGPFNNTAQTGAHVVFTGLADNKETEVVIKIGIRGAPTTGDPKWTGTFTKTSYIVNADLNGAVRWTGSLRPAFGQAAPVWGTI